MSTLVAASLRPADSLEALVLVDNVSDSLSTCPAHCTGWRAFTALANACDEGVLLPSAVGRTFVFQ